MTSDTALLVALTARAKRMVMSARRRAGFLWQWIWDPASCGSRIPGRVKVGYVPWWRTNPYQVRLKQELAALDVDVCDTPLDLRHLLCALRSRGEVDVIHIHWPHGTYLGRYWRFPFVLAFLGISRLLRNNLVWTVHELEFYEPAIRSWTA